MKQFFLDLLNSEAFWFGVTALLAYLANTIVSRKWVAKLPPTNPVRRIIRALHGFIDKIDPAGALVLLACSSLLLPLCSGCNSISLHTTVEKALVFEQQAQSQSAALKSLADAIIPTLPLDKQDEARSKVADLYVKLSESFAAKDAMLQAALDASESKVDISKIAADIVVVVGEIVSLLKTFGVVGDQLTSLEAQGAALKASAGRL